MIDGEQAFRCQRANAVRRQIAWELTLDEWRSIWQASGRWRDRGRGRDAYCMARKGDVGPYSAANVDICTNSENIKDFRRVHRERHNAALSRGHLEKALLQRGWTMKPTISGTRGGKPYQVTFRKKYIGMFSTQVEAEAAHRDAVLESLSA